MDVTYVNYPGMRSCPQDIFRQELIQLCTNVQTEYGFESHAQVTQRPQIYFVYN